MERNWLTDLTEYWHFLLVYGGLGGLGTALMYVPCLAVIGHYFKTGRGTALGIAVSSGAFGGIVFPLMLQELLPSIGFAWSTRILGFIYLFLCIIANLLIKPRLSPDTNTRSTPSFRILQKPIFALTVLGVFMLEWGLFVPLTYICSYAMAQGFSMSEAFNALITLNVGSLLGRILPGILADRIGGYNTNILVTLLAIISTFGVWLPAGQTLPGLTLFALLFGFASGSNISLTPVCLGQTCRVEEYGRYFATCFTVVSIGCLTGVPIAGAIINAAGGSYWGLIVFTGTCYGVGLAAIIAARVLGTGWRVNVRF
jgi:MFS family permease